MNILKVIFLRLAGPDHDTATPFNHKLLGEMWKILKNKYNNSWFSNSLLWTKWGWMIFFTLHSLFTQTHKASYNMMGKMDSFLLSSTHKHHIALSFFNSSIKAVKSSKPFVWSRKHQKVLGNRQSLALSSLKQSHLCLWGSHFPNEMMFKSVQSPRRFWRFVDKNSLWESPGLMAKGNPFLAREALFASHKRIL